MQLAMSAFTKVFGGLAKSVGLGAAGAGSGGLSAGQIGLTALKVIGGLGAAAGAAADDRALADQAELQDGQEQVASTQRQSQMKRSLLKALGENEVTFAAAGIDVSQGIAKSSADDAKRRAAQEITIERQDSDFRRAQYRARAAGYRRRAGRRVGGALLGAVGTIANAGLDFGQRGNGIGGGGSDPWVGLR